MKLILCTECHDVLSLRTDRVKTCVCGKSGGRYIDNLNAEAWGAYVPLGFANWSINSALMNRPQGPGQGVPFEAFVIPFVCDTFVRVDEPDVGVVPGRRFTKAQREDMRRAFNLPFDGATTPEAEAVVALLRKRFEALLDDADRADDIIQNMLLEMLQQTQALSDTAVARVKKAANELE